MYLSRETGPFIEAITAGKESIPLADWLELVAADPELELVLEEQQEMKLLANGVTSSGKLITVEWIAHPNEEWVVFEWKNGLVESHRPDLAICSKLLAMALKLRGTLQDDDGQMYHSIEQMTSGPPPAVGVRPAVVIEI